MDGGNKLFSKSFGFDGRLENSGARVDHFQVTFRQIMKIMCVGAQTQQGLQTSVSNNNNNNNPNLMHENSGR
jgi:hypothetical protein